MEEPLILVETAAGLLIFEGEDVKTYPFRSVEEAAEYYAGSEKGAAPGSVASFLRRWKGRNIMVERRSLAKALTSLGLKPVVEEPLKKAVELRADAGRVSSMLGLGTGDYTGFTVRVSNTLAKARVEELARGRDLDIIMAMQAYDDLVKMLNVLQERILIWVRERRPSLLEEHTDVEKLVEHLASLDGFETEYVRRMAELYLKMRESKKTVEENIGMLMEEKAPNLSMVVGPLLGARLISKTGSLSRLASLPASTIQVLGAEKALFRAVRKKGRPPKHGIIFQHPWVHGSPRRIRGKAARLLASRIAVAARVDFFSGRMVGEDLKKDVENRLKSLRSGEE